MRPGRFFAVCFSFCVAAAAARADAPPLKMLQQNPGPDGNVASRGVLPAPFCFAAPPPQKDEVCLPKGSTVDVETKHPGPNDDDGAAAREARTTLRAFRAPRDVAVAGVPFAKGHDVELWNDTIKGRLARPVAGGGRVFSGDVEVVVGEDGVARVVAGVLDKDADVGGFRVPAGYRVDVRSETSGIVSFSRVRGQAVATRAAGAPASVTTYSSEMERHGRRRFSATVAGFAFGGVSFDGVVSVVEAGGVVDVVCGSGGCVCADGRVVDADAVCAGSR